MAVKKIFPLFLIFFLTSCFPTTNYSLKKLRLNDSKPMVLKIMGKPSSISMHYNKEFLVYYIHDDFFDLIFPSKFPFVGFYPLTRTGKKYWIVLEDGHLISYGEAEYYNIDKDQRLSIKQK